MSPRQPTTIAAVRAPAATASLPLPRLGSRPSHSVRLLALRIIGHRCVAVLCAPQLCRRCASRHLAHRFVIDTLVLTTCPLPTPAASPPTCRSCAPPAKPAPTHSFSSRHTHSVYSRRLVARARIRNQLPLLAPRPLLQQACIRLMLFLCRPPHRPLKCPPSAVVLLMSALMRPSRPFEASHVAVPCGPVLVMAMALLAPARAIVCCVCVCV